MAIAAQWSAASGTWIEIGEVTGASNAGTINGKRFRGRGCLYVYV